MNCRTGCKTKDHSNWGECARAADIGLNAVMVSPLKEVFEVTNRELPAYKRLRKEGIQPEGTSTSKMNEAMKATKVLGRPYNANADPPAKFITPASKPYMKEGI